MHLIDASGAIKEEFCMLICRPVPNTRGIFATEMQEFTEKNLISPQRHRVHREEEKNRRRTLIPIFVNSVSLW
jgi:hypothetical protein